MAILSLADSLEVLDLSDNQLSSLPEEISTLTHLKILFASNNCFTALPAVLGQCPQLEMIGFKSNHIIEVPAAALPKKLRWLILTDNKITQLPEALGERTRLQKLALAGNCLRQLPDSFGQLHNLELLRLSANQLQTFPPQLLLLPKLAWLAFAGNPFSESNTLSQSVPEISAADYRLQTVLGEGASGVIYQAQWANLKDAQPGYPEDIAVKVFKGAVTSDGYPKDELAACLKVGTHPSLTESIAQVNENGYLALVMALIPPRFKNLGAPPSLQSCTRDTFAPAFYLPIKKILKIVAQMQAVFEHLHDKKVCHGDLYAHNTLFDPQGNIIFGDFGAATMYHMLPTHIQISVKEIEQRALNHFIDDLLGICDPKDIKSQDYQTLHASIHCPA